MLRKVELCRAVAKWGFLGLVVVGVAYTLAYMWPVWPVSVGLITSGAGVGFLYWFLGGYGLMKTWFRSNRGSLESPRPFALTLAAVALWDLASPLVFRDFHWISLAAHFTGGLVALTCAGALVWEESVTACETPRAARKPGAT
jgi:hypothetical protein